jgi:hypothetical protein
MFENRALRRMFGPKRDKIVGGWRKLHCITSWLALLATCNYQVKDDGMSRVCNTRRIGEECILRKAGCGCGLNSSASGQTSVAPLADKVKNLLVP